jgi:hypothetical protein
MTLRVLRFLRVLALHIRTAELRFWIKGVNHLASLFFRAAARLVAPGLKPAVGIDH